jgi:hypothetical protein
MKLNVGMLVEFLVLGAGKPHEMGVFRQLLAKMALVHPLVHVLGDAHARVLGAVEGVVAVGEALFGIDHVAADFLVLLGLLGRDLPARRRVFLDRSGWRRLVEPDAGATGQAAPTVHVLVDIGRRQVRKRRRAARVRRIDRRQGPFALGLPQRPEAGALGRFVAHRLIPEIPLALQLPRAPSLPRLALALGLDRRRAVGCRRCAGRRPLAAGRPVTGNRLCRHRVRFRFEPGIGVGRHLSSPRGDPPGALLDYVRQLVAEQPLARRRPRPIRLRGNVDVATAGEGVGVDQRRVVPHVQADVGKIGGERPLHLDAHRRRQRTPTPARPQPFGTDLHRREVVTGTTVDDLWVRTGCAIEPIPIGTAKADAASVRPFPSRPFPGRRGKPRAL